MPLAVTNRGSGKEALVAIFLDQLSHLILPISSSKDWSCEKKDGVMDVIYIYLLLRENYLHGCLHGVRLKIGFPREAVERTEAAVCQKFLIQSRKIPLDVLTF